MSKELKAIFEEKEDYLLLNGECLSILKDIPCESINCVITSPPYWNQRKYDFDSKNLPKDYVPIGEESDYRDYISNLSTIFAEIKRVLKKDGSFWLNLGDKYYNKNLLGLPWRVALAMQDDGWILRNDIIWDQMKGTQSAKDRLRDIYEHIFHFVKANKYYYDHEKIRIKPSKKATNVNGTMVSATGVSGTKYKQQITDSEVLSDSEKKNALKALEETIEEMKRGEVIDFRMTIRGEQRIYHSDNKKVSGRANDLKAKGFYILKMKSNGHIPSDIWRIVPEDKWRKDAHYAVFPEDLLLNPILATCPENGIVLDPFSGIGSTVAAAVKLGRKGIGIEISSHYHNIAKTRMKQETKKYRLFYP